MTFFSGFCFKNEEKLFETYLDQSTYCVAGFSLGAIDALEYVLNTTSRIDKLQLFSPAYFLDKDTKFKRAQLHYFKKDETSYMNRFMQNVAYPSSQNLTSYLCDGTKIELDKLLNFNWKDEDLKLLKMRGIEIEVYLGGKDKIIDPQEAKKFFLPFSTVYFIKQGGHILYG